MARTTEKTSNSRPPRRKRGDPAIDRSIPEFPCEHPEGTDEEINPTRQHELSEAEEADDSEDVESKAVSDPC